jgi:hypothetical protein
MIHVRFEPSQKNATLVGHVEIDGRDISHRVQTLRLRRSHDGCTVLHLGLVLYDNDVVDLELPDEVLTSARATIIKDGELIEVTAVGDYAKKLAAAR